MLVGMLLVFVGSILFVINVSEGSGAWRYLHGAIVILGVFMIAEGAFGWCALRALLKKK